MSITEDTIPSSIRPFLNEIAERLWAGRAAVMVGAGFSKNAGDGFPDWNQLGDLFYEKAHGQKPDPAVQKYLNVLRLAEEVQAAIGRPALENLLRSNIPDLENEPSGLHVELLEFPWTDVFTTNYDTLLERASAKVIARRYEPVVNKQDIPYAISPRIVKLHGSFPSERPFIITEEDYRRYPYDFAPFVNTVQQALLENTFCLIGFSGDDPNFLQWIGWIRDNLGGDKTQKIFLVGVFNLSSARKELLARRGIVVVDLIQCFGVQKRDHEKALRVFFEYMRSQKQEILDWPYGQKTMHPNLNADRIGEIKKITKEWSEERRTFPGWLVLPHGNRDDLWTLTRAWVEYLPDAGEFPFGLDLQYAFELIWRLERCLLPIFSKLAGFCENILEKYRPFPSESQSKSSEIRSEDKAFESLEWTEVRHAWLAIALAMLRFYREEGHLDKWKMAEGRLNTLVDYLSVEEREFLHYERFLFHLFTLDLLNAKKCLASWTPNESQPYWQAKKAASFAEIGQLSDSASIIGEALENIRKKLNQKANSSDLNLISLESNAMLLGKLIQDAAAFGRNGVDQKRKERTQFKDRWNELKRFKCDPWNELEFFELALGKPPSQRREMTEKREFDIGRITRTHHLGNEDTEALVAYSFLRFCEEVAMPFRVGIYAMATGTAVASLQRISRYSVFWATATLARLGDVDSVDSLYSRESVYRISANEADRLIQSYFKALDGCSDDIRNGDALRNDNWGIRVAQLLPEVISRLCCKCSDGAKRQILKFITELYSSPYKVNYRNSRNLTSRLLGSMSEVNLYGLVPDLLNIPFPENLNLVVEKEFLNPFLYLRIDKKPEFIKSPLEVPFECTAELFQEARSNDGKRRRWAITSLVTLHNLELLDVGQRKDLAEVLWLKTDQYGLPEGTDFYKFAFLKLPWPDHIDAIQCFKNWVKRMQFPAQEEGGDKRVSLTGGNIPLITEIIGANKTKRDIWTPEDAKEILRRLLEWWNADRDKLGAEKVNRIGFPSMAEEYRSRCNRLVDLLADVVGPNLDENCPSDVKSSLNQLLREIREKRLPYLEAEATCLHIFPEKRTEIYRQIGDALLSNDESIEADGLEAIARIILADADDIDGETRSDPTSTLAQFLTWCPTRSSIKAMWVLIRILNSGSVELPKNIEMAAERRLGRLLSESDFSSGNSDLKFDEKLEVRRVGAILAARFWKYCTINELPIPSVTEEWREICLSPNEFAEIRNAWLDVAGAGV